MKPRIAAMRPGLFSRPLHLTVRACLAGALLHLAPAPGRAQVSLQFTQVPGNGYVEAHIVQKGESLYGIARKHQATPEALIKWNQLKSSTIYPGQRLLVHDPAAPAAEGISRSAAPVQAAAARPESSESPDAAARRGSTQLSLLALSQQEREAQPEASRRAEPAAAAVPLPPDAMLTRKQFHEVQAGETVYAIAERYRVTVEELRFWNAVTDVHPGQVLIVGQQLEPAAALRTAVPAAASRSIAAPERSSLKLLDPEAGAQPPVYPAEEVYRSAMPAKPARTLETGPFMQFEKKLTNGNRFYAIHKELPVGSRVRMLIPDNTGYIEVEIVDRLAANSEYLAGLSPACVRILQGAGETSQVTFLLP
jgi:LysM repeat protein